MSRIEYKDWAVNSTGDVVGGSAVEVRVQSTGALADLYDAATAGALLSNPLNAEADGSFVFFVEPGKYDVTVGSGASESTKPLYALRSDITYPTIAAMALAETAAVGDVVSVDAAFNGGREEYEATSGGLTADGALVVDGVGVQWVSKRTVYADFAEFDADPRDMTGATLQFGPYRVEAVSTDEHYETTGGNKARVLAGEDGRYAASAFGETWDRLVLATNLELPLNITTEYEASTTVFTGKDIQWKRLPGGHFNFPAANANDLTLDGCSGKIEDYAANHTGDLGGGSFTGLYLYRCDGLEIHGYNITGSKDTPVRIFDCDDTWAAWGKSVGGVTRPYAGIVACSQNSGFYFCRARDVNFGFVMLGAGYKSGGYVPPRTFDQEQGMFIRDCYIYDHTGHAFDINGVVAGQISRCVGQKYTGTGGNSTFQIKNSTNIGGETADGTRVSVIENCTAIDGSIGFGGQATKGATFRGNTAIGSHGYAFYLNDCDEAVIDGINIEDWAQKPIAASAMIAGQKYIIAAVGSTDFTSFGSAANASGRFFTATGPATGTGTVFKAVNDEEKISAIGVSASSDAVSLRGVAIRQQNVLYPLAMGQVYLGGNIARFHDMKVSRLVGQSVVAEGLKIVGQNCSISDQVIPTLATDLLIDNAQTTQYSMRYSKTFAFSAGGTQNFDAYPPRGMTVGSVSCYVLGGTVTDHTFTLGRVGANSSVQTTRAVATGAARPTATQLDPGFPIQSFVNTTGGTVTVNVTVSGVPLI